MGGENHQRVGDKEESSGKENENDANSVTDEVDDSYDLIGKDQGGAGAADSLVAKNQEQKLGGQNQNNKDETSERSSDSEQEGERKEEADVKEKETSHESLKGLTEVTNLVFRRSHLDTGAF